MLFGKYISNFSWDIGIDLGTCNTLIYLKQRGVVINEPTMIARIKKRKITRPVAYGYKAREMFEREPMQIEVISPIKNGSINDLDALEKLISYYLKLIHEIPGKYPRLFKPRVLVGVPSFLNQVNKRAIKQLFKNEGASEVIMCDQAVLSAVGLGISLDIASGMMIVDIGGGKTEIGVISMGGVVVGKNILVAGKSIDMDIINFIKMKYSLVIGQLSAEKIKIANGGIVRGRDLSNGLPKSIKVSAGEIREAIGLSLNKIVKTIAKVLDETPPELVDGILKRGIILVGGGSKIEGLGRLIEDEMKVGARVIDEPDFSVIRGAGELIENPDKLSSVNIISNV